MQNIFIELLPPWIETGLQPAFYDKESGTVLQQTARMYAKVNELIANVNKFEEDVSDVVNEYVAKFTELHNYVHDYFDNLDVQEEINNKLDALVEDGTLQELVNNYLQPNVTWTFDTVADMKLSENLISGGYAKTLGFHTINDGGGATYYITDSGTADEMQVIAVGTLFANLVINNEINVKQLGAYGDGETDDTTVFTKALTLTYPVYVPKGAYIVSSTLTLNNRIIHGDGQFNTFIKFTNDITSYAVTINSDHNKISDLTIESPNYDYEVKGTSNTKTGIYISQHHHLTLSNVRIVGFNVGMYANRAWCLSLYDVMTLCCNTGISGDVDFNNILLERCIIHTCTTGLLINSGSGIKVDSCDIENNDTGVQVVNNVSVNLDTCYFERNTVCSVYIRFGTTWVRQVVIENCTFYENSTVSAIKYHSDPSANITIQNCEFRNNPTLSAGSLRILLRESNSNNVPHVIGCFIGDSWTLGERCYLNKLYPEALTPTDMFDITSGYEFQDFAVYVENNHVFGTATVYYASGIPASNTVVATFKDRFKPIAVPLTFGALSSAQYGQDSNNLCYVYMNSYSGLTIKGDGTHTRARISFDYVI